MSFTAAAALSVVALGDTVAQESSADSCEVKDVNGMVTLVLCPPDLQPQQLAEAGRMACGDRPICGAWIWDDAANMPEAAPAQHDQLTSEQVASASGVWVAEQQQLVTIEDVPAE